ncbi:MAG: YqhA family protein [Thermodesulfovibrionales bacterium]|nr:YqhA family protein [Thermodesulfovibrionales bacterium]
MKKFETFTIKVLERLLWESRLILIVAVIASLLASTLMVFLGTYDIITLIKKVFSSFFAGTPNIEYLQKEAIAKIIGAVDNYLIATVLLIFGLGLYTLFISKIEHIEKDTKSSKILMIHSLDQLKEKIAKVILMVLIVLFFKYSIDQNNWDMINLLMLSVGILLIAIAFYFMNIKK